MRVCVLNLQESLGRQRILNMELPGRQKTGRTQRKFVDVVKEDMQRVSVAEE